MNFYPVLVLSLACLLTVHAVPNTPIGQPCLDARNNLCGTIQEIMMNRIKCNYERNVCEKFDRTASGTCLNDNKAKDNFYALGTSDRVPIFKLSMTNQNQQPPRGGRCGARDVGTRTESLLRSGGEDEEKIGRAAIEILDALFWLSDIRDKKCQDFQRYTLSIARMHDDSIYLAGNLNFAKRISGTWKTFLPQVNGVKLAIKFILTKWGFPINNVHVLQLPVTFGKQTGIFMQYHAEMQLLKFAKDKNKRIVAMGVSKPPCWKCDASLSDPKLKSQINQYRLDNEVTVYSGPGTQQCDKDDKTWCGHQYGAFKGEERSWTTPGSIYLRNVKSIKIE